MIFGATNDSHVIHKIEVKAEKILPVPPLNLRYPPPMHPGHKFYECDLEKQTLQEVKYAVKAAYFKSSKTEMMYYHRPNCYYLTALNEDNALKKFIKYMAKRKGLKFKDTTKNGKSTATA